MKSPFRFEGLTNASDEAEIFVIEAKDGTKGTLVLAGGSDKSQNAELRRSLRQTKRR